MSLPRFECDAGLIDKGVRSEKHSSESNSVRRALAILEFLKDSNRRPNLSEVSRRLALPKSTTSVLLSTLESTGYITRDTEQRRYSLCSKAFGFGLELQSQLDLSRRARPILEAVSSALNVTAHVAVLDGDQALFVRKVDGDRQPCCDIYPGRRANLHCTAVGKVLLACLSDDERGMFLARHPLLRQTSRAAAAPQDLVDELGGVNRRGYALDNGEEEPHIRCVAVPICSAWRTVGALGITGTPVEIRPGNVEDIAEYLKEMSGRIFAA